MFSYVPNPNADPVVVGVIVLVAIVVLGFVVWMSYAEKDSASGSGSRRKVRGRRKQKSGFMTASKIGNDPVAKAKINSSAFLGERFKPKSNFNLWMEGNLDGNVNTKNQEEAVAEKKKDSPDWLSGAA